MRAAARADRRSGIEEVSRAAVRDRWDRGLEPSIAYNPSARRNWKNDCSAVCTVFIVRGENRLLVSDELDHVRGAENGAGRSGRPRGSFVFCPSSYAMGARSAGSAER